MIGIKNCRSLILLVFVSILIQSIGCGYHFRADGKPVGSKIESIANTFICK